MNIEASCYREGTGALVLVECRRKSKRRVEQEEAAGFAYRIRDVGAAEDLMITTVSRLPRRGRAEGGECGPDWHGNSQC